MPSDYILADGENLDISSRPSTNLREMESGVEDANKIVPSMAQQ